MRTPVVDYLLYLEYLYSIPFICTMKANKDKDKDN